MQVPCASGFVDVVLHTKPEQQILVLLLNPPQGMLNVLQTAGLGVGDAFPVQTPFVQVFPFVQLFTLQVIFSFFGLHTPPLVEVVYIHV